MQPRLGFAWDITGDATNILRGSWGRFMHPANSSVPSEDADCGNFLVFNYPERDCQGFTVGSQIRLVLIGSVLNATSTEQRANATDICEQTHGCADPEGDGQVNFGSPIDWKNSSRYDVGFRIEF